MGRRVQKSVYTYETDHWTLTTDHQFLYDGWNLVKETTTPDGGSSVDKYYVWGLDLSQSVQGAGGVGGLLAVIDGSLTYQYLYDANGNVGQLVDAADGTIAARYEYDPYGNLTDLGGAYVDANAYRFSTKYYDTEISLYYYGYRYYSAKLGRWINRDPAQESVNPYSFIDNDVTNALDYLGLWKRDWDQFTNDPRAKGVLESGDSNTIVAAYNEWLKQKYNQSEITDIYKNTETSTSSGTPLVIDQIVIQYFKDLGVKIKTIVEVGNKGMEAQAKIDIALGLDWRGGTMSDSYKLLERRSKYSALRYKGFKHNKDSWKCIGACAIVAVIGEDNDYPLDGEIHTWAFGKLGDLALKKAKEQGLKTVTVRFGSKFLPVIGAFSTANTVIDFLYCNVRCQDCGNSKER